MKKSKKITKKKYKDYSKNGKSEKRSIKKLSNSPVSKKLQKMNRHKLLVAFDAFHLKFSVMSHKFSLCFYKETSFIHSKALKIERGNRSTEESFWYCQYPKVDS